MRIRTCGLSLAACAFALAGAGGLAVPGMAQDTSQHDSGVPQDVANKKIDLDLESTNLYYGLKLLFSQVKANFTIDESLKSLTVTAHLSQVPFRVALETLLKSTGTPLTYKVESGIYSVVPKVEEPEQPPQPELTQPSQPAGTGFKYGIIRPNNLSAIDIVMAFGGHIVSVGYNPASYGMGGLGGSGGTGGIGGNGLGGGLGGFGGNGTGNFGGYGGNTGYGSGYGGYGSSGYGYGGDSGYRPGITNPPAGSSSGGVH